MAAAAAVADTVGVRRLRRRRSCRQRSSIVYSWRSAIGHLRCVIAAARRERDDAADIVADCRSTTRITPANVAAQKRRWRRQRRVHDEAVAVEKRRRQRQRQVAAAAHHCTPAIGRQFSLLPIERQSPNCQEDDSPTSLTPRSHRLRLLALPIFLLSPQPASHDRHHRHQLTSRSTRPILLIEDGRHNNDDDDLTVLMATAPGVALVCRIVHIR